MLFLISGIFSFLKVLFLVNVVKDILLLNVIMIVFGIIGLFDFKYWVILLMCEEIFGFWYLVKLFCFCFICEIVVIFWIVFFLIVKLYSLCLGFCLIFKVGIFNIVIVLIWNFF